MTDVTRAELAVRINALSDFARREVLYYLSGYAPEVLAAALDEVEGQDGDV